MRTTALALALGSLLALPVHAAEPEDYAGHFVLADADAAQAELDRAVEAGVSQFPAVIRPIARGKLKDAVQAVEWFVFEPGSDTMTIKTSVVSQGWTTDLEATPTDVQTPDGETLALKRWMKNGNLMSEGCRESGCSAFSFELSDDGQRLTMQVVTSSKRLEEPLRYALQYRRK